MALREYHLGDRTYQFDDEDVPDGATLVEPEKPAQKAAPRKPANKQAAAPADKSAGTDDKD